MDAKSDQRLGNATDLVTERHPPPQIGVLRVDIHAITSDGSHLIHIQRHRRVADRQKIAALHHRPQFFGGALRTPELPGTAIPRMIVGQGIDQPGIGVLDDGILQLLDASRVGHVVCVHPHQPRRSRLVQDPVQGRRHACVFLLQDPQPRPRESNPRHSVLESRRYAALPSDPPSTTTRIWKSELVRPSKLSIAWGSQGVASQTGIPP